MIADFFLQSSNMEEKKQNNIKALLAHSCIYLLVFAVIDFTFIQPLIAIWVTLILFITHIIIDFIIIKIDNRVVNKQVRILTFIIDQILHLSTIIVLYYCFDLALKVNTVYSNFESYSNFKEILMYFLLFVVLLDPAAVFIKKLNAFLFKEEIDSNYGNNAGSTIGKLERIITAILLLCDQYNVIGLVLTAKSIARFRQLEEKDFAEKYLIGTLLSLSISLILTIAVKYVLSL